MYSRCAVSVWIYDMLLLGLCSQDTCVLIQLASHYYSNDRPYESSRHRVSRADMGSYFHRNNCLYDQALFADQPH